MTGLISSQHENINIDRYILFIAGIIENYQKLIINGEIFNDNNAVLLPISDFSHRILRLESYEIYYYEVHFIFTYTSNTYIQFFKKHCYMYITYTPRYICLGNQMFKINCHTMLRLEIYQIGS